MEQDSNSDILFTLGLKWDWDDLDLSDLARLSLEGRFGRSVTDMLIESSQD